jgi:beta-N-acetylhexosaminidase
MQVPAQPKSNDIASLLPIAQDGRTVIVATSDVAKNRQQIDLVNALTKARVPLIVIAMRSPYDTLYMKNVPTYLAVYGAPPPTLDALVGVLHGRTRAQGRLPVELPELPQ